MNYNQRRPVTMIDDLPDIDYLEGNNQQGGGGGDGGYFDDYYQNNNSNTQVNKYIRGEHMPPNESGMYAQHYQQKPSPRQTHFDEIIQEPRTFKAAAPLPPPKPQINCLDLADHIENCPLCSQIYKTDRTPYIIIIVILAIICVLLIKKVLNL